MSRKIILTLAAAATLGVASFASSSSHARGLSGGVHFGGGGHVGGSVHLSGRVALNPGRGRPGLPGRPGWAFHGHGHWIFREGRWIIVDTEVADAVPDLVPPPAPCTCLTKTYTPDGLVVFTDTCTKESASAPVNGSAADATPVPPESQKN